MSHQCGKRVKTKSYKVLGASSYVCISYRGRGRGDFFAPPPPILNRVKSHMKTKIMSFQNYFPLFSDEYVISWKIIANVFICLVT